MLRDRRREVQGEVQRRLSGRRTARLRDVSDELEDSDAHVQGDIDLALLQMKVETVLRALTCAGDEQRHTPGDR